jgi:hypothetical protein
MTLNANVGLNISEEILLSIQAANNVTTRTVNIKDSSSSSSSSFRETQPEGVI